MTDTLRRLERQMLEEHGWHAGTDLEDAAALRLHRAGFHPGPGDVRQQLHVGRFWLDFAWPALRIALETDGWHHRSPEGAAWDAERDSWLRSQGWIVLRVDDRHGRDSFDEQMVRVCRLVHCLKAAR